MTGSFRSLPSRVATDRETDAASSMDAPPTGWKGRRSMAPAHGSSSKASPVGLISTRAGPHRIGCLGRAWVEGRGRNQCGGGCVHSLYALLMSNRYGPAPLSPWRPLHLQRRHARPECTDRIGQRCGRKTRGRATHRGRLRPPLPDHELFVGCAPPERLQSSKPRASASCGRWAARKRQLFDRRAVEPASGRRGLLVTSTRDAFLLKRCV